MNTFPKRSTRLYVHAIGYNTKNKIFSTALAYMPYKGKQYRYLKKQGFYFSKPTFLRDLIK